MNQAFQVLDGCIYVDEKKALKVDVMANGQILACYISGSDKETLTTLYSSKQFEIEEIIEMVLEQDKENVDGEIWLTAEDVSKY
jgi:hypothetical protein